MTFSSYKVSDRDGTVYDFQSQLNGAVHIPCHTDPTTQSRIGVTDGGAAGSDTATSGLLGLVKRLLTRITNLIDILPTTLESGRFTTTITRGFSEFQTASVAVSTSATTVVIIDTQGVSRIGLQVENQGAGALNLFEVAVRYNEALGGFYNPRVSTAADFTTERGLALSNPLKVCIDASGNLSALAAGASGWLELNVANYRSIRINCRGAAATSVRISGIAVA